MELDVTYLDGEPERIEYQSMTYGLVRFHMEDGTAVIDDKWDSVDVDALKDGFTQSVFTRDVIDAVRELPFVDAVEVDGYTTPACGFGNALEVRL